MANDLIFELGCEELPSRAVWPLAEELTNNLTAALEKAQLAFGTVKTFATPRRLAVSIYDLQSEQASQTQLRKGPAKVAAFDQDGKPTPALIGFAKSCGVSVEELSCQSTDKGDWMVYESKSQPTKTKELLPTLLRQAFASLSIPKPMRWGSGNEEFARPVHWVVLMYADEVLHERFFGIQSSNQSRGHRFHHPDLVTITAAKNYEKALQEAYVIADFAKRRQIIKEQVEQLAAANQAKAIMPADLLDEVTSIVEWPVALLAHFEQEFLQVPAEALIASMQTHQKCFALTNSSGDLLAHFITVANIKSSNAQQVVLGNEKVMRARLSDAAFFFKQDKKQALAEHVSATKQVVFQAKLGSLYDKSLRMQAIMEYLSQALNLNPEQARRAAVLSKCDLMTGMVGEFPELQGLMGYYYALHDGEDAAVAQALNEQYMPRFAADNLPQSDLGTALSIADRIDTLVGIFAIGQKPTGVKDPFKLRRHALAVARMLIAIPAAVNISTLIVESLKHYDNKAVLGELKPFILERLQSWYQGQGINADLLLAVRARQDEWLYDLDKRLQALQEFVALPEAESLAAACKRVGNILSQSKMTDASLTVNPSLLQPGAEQDLYANIQSLSKLVEPLYASADYPSLLKHLASLKQPIDNFFDSVMVMVDEEAVKNNRLAVLQKLQDLLQGVADISLLQKL